MMNTGTIFYNGFNLMLDIFIALIVYRASYKAGWLRGYGEGAEDKRSYDDRLIDYYIEQQREAKS